MRIWNLYYTVFFHPGWLIPKCNTLYISVLLSSCNLPNILHSTHSPIPPTYPSTYLHTYTKYLYTFWNIDFLLLAPIVSSLKMKFFNILKIYYLNVYVCICVYWGGMCTVPLYIYIFFFLRIRWSCLQ